MFGPCTQSGQSDQPRLVRPWWIQFRRDRRGENRVLRLSKRDSYSRTRLVAAADESNSEAVVAAADERRSADRMGFQLSDSAENGAIE